MKETSTVPGCEAKLAYGFHAARPGMSKTSSESCSSAAQSSQAIRRKALELGGDLMGICHLDRRWLTEKSTLGVDSGTPALPWVVVLGVAMKPSAFRNSPSPAIIEETRRGYRRMKDIACALGEHIACLGHNALSAGNGEAMSVPLAIDAGLGALGRNGLLLAPGLGSCLRLCKVFTDMPLEPTSKRGPAFAERCEDCVICAEACPSKAIAVERRPPEGRWRVHPERCGDHWSQTKQQCAACISACPATWEDGEP